MTAIVLGLLVQSCASVSPDAGLDDAGPLAPPDASAFDAGAFDAGAFDAGVVDGGPSERASVSVSSAVAKVKNVLIGIAPTEEEVQAVAANPGALKDLVAGWIALPQYKDKMLTFFTTQFQQDEWSYNDLIFQFGSKNPFVRDQRRIMDNLQQSYGRTALELIAEGKPFTATMDTNRLMMTPAIMALYATQDVIQTDDRFAVIDLFQRDHPSQVTLQSATTIPLEQSVDPASPNFFIFNAPSIATSYAPDCPYGTIVYPSPAPYSVIFDLIYGYRAQAVNNGQCVPPVERTGRYIVDSDFTDWRMVTVRPPVEGEATTNFYDLPALRNAHELVLRVPRVGFFTTPAFFARWPTNNSNQFRVLANQTLIVALGESIGLSNATHPSNLAALDTAHAAPGTTCYECHQTLDPMRQFFRQNYTTYFSTQDNAAMRAMDGQFGFRDVLGSGSHIQDLATILASHPRLAPAWVQKLCTYATSAPCDEDDPEFQRLVDVFVSSHHSWTALVKELFSSPLVTYLGRADSPESGQVFPVAHRNHLCAVLSSRLGRPDICSLKSAAQPAIPVLHTLAGSFPTDQYARGSTVASLDAVPSLMIRGGMESLCSELADRFVDIGNSGYSSQSPTTSMQNLATKLMGLTSDRADGAVTILQEHFNAAVAGGAPPGTALRSTFVLACMSPYVAGMGQ